jgi:Fe-S-cluster-containing dehydrogenase component
VIKIKKIVINEEICTGCRICELACSIKNEEIYNTELSRIIKLSDGLPENPLTIVCQQCPDAPCIKNCPVQAIYINTEKDIVEIDLEKCIGCKKCVKVCPYNAMFFNEKTKKPFKCEFCGGEPACIKKCPTHAISILDY